MAEAKKTTKKRTTYPKVSQEIRYPETGDVALVPLNNRQRRLLARQRREAGAPPLVEGEVIITAKSGGWFAYKHFNFDAGF
mgnify:CR=1 FL=1